MMTEEEYNEEMLKLSAGVQKIFEDAVNQPPFVAGGTGEKGDES